MTKQPTDVELVYLSQQLDKLETRIETIYDAQQHMSVNVSKKLLTRVNATRSEITAVQTLRTFQRRLDKELRTLDRAIGSIYNKIAKIERAKKPVV